MMFQQTIVSLLLMGAMSSVFLAIRACSYSRRLAELVNVWDVRQFRENRVHMMNSGMFLEFEDRLILDELPRADYSQGGMYFFGSSPMKWGLAAWTLPPAVQRVVGNYGIGATNHRLQYAFIRHLVEHDGLLQAGGDKVHVVLGLYYSMGQNWKAESYFKPLWERYGLYTYSDTQGIQPVRLNPLLRSLRVDRARCTGFIGSSVTRLARAAAGALHIPLSPTEKIQNPKLVRDWAIRLSHDDSAGLKTQMVALNQITDYLAQRRVAVTVVLLPERAPFADLPEPIAYHNAVRAFCGAHAIPIVDLSRLLAEEEFWDVNHSNYRGLMKTHAALMELARKELREMGVAP